MSYCYLHIGGVRKGQEGCRCWTPRNPDKAVGLGKRYCGACCHMGPREPKVKTRQGRLA